MKEREIRLIDLFVETMLHWRTMILWMIAGAVLAGAFCYIRSDQASETSEGVEPVQMSGQDQIEYASALEEQLTDAQLQNVNYVIAYEAVYKEKEAYQMDSLYMKMDPNRVQRTDMTFYVDADNWRIASSIEKAYEDMMQSGELRAYAAKQVHLENTGSISEAVSLVRGAGSLAEGTNTFRVSIVHYDKAVMQDIADAVASFLKNKHDQIAETMGAHEIVLLNRSEAVVTDMSILESQKNTIDDIATMETTILQYKDAFTAEEQQYYDFITESADSEDADDETQESSESTGSGNQTSSGIRLKYVILGMFLAVFLYVFLFFMRFVFQNKLCASDNLQELYGIPQLGMIPQPQENRTPFACIDQWILSLRDSGRRRFTKDEALRLSAAAVRMAAMKEGMGKICLVGCALSEQALEVCEAIRDSLAKDGIQAEILNNVLYDAQAMYRLEGAGAAVLVECVQSTLYSEIAREIELLGRQEITVLGGIVTAS